MELIFQPFGPPELKREDGWFYRLHGIGPIECEIAYSEVLTMNVTVYDLSDRTLDSIRVLRDQFPENSIRLHHDY